MHHSAAEMRTGISPLRVNSILAPVAAHIVAAPQRVFVTSTSRQIAGDSVGFDGVMASTPLLPCTRAASVLFDSANAFQALGHAWICAVLREMDIPPADLHHSHALH